MLVYVYYVVIQISINIIIRSLVLGEYQWQKIIIRIEKITALGTNWSDGSKFYGSPRTVLFLRIDYKGAYLKNPLFVILIDV